LDFRVKGAEARANGSEERRELIAQNNHRLTNGCSCPGRHFRYFNHARWKKTAEYQEWCQKEAGPEEPGWVQLFNGNDRASSNFLRPQTVCNGVTAHSLCR
jgi:hypothetical protein